MANPQLTILDYARHHGLALPTTLLPPPLSHVPSASSFLTSDPDFDAFHGDIQIRARAQLREWEVAERLQIDSRAVVWFAHLLRQVDGCGAVSGGGGSSVRQGVGSRAWFKRVRIERPALRSDHEWDVVDFREGDGFGGNGVQLLDFGDEDEDEAERGNSGYKEGAPFTYRDEELASAEEFVDEMTGEKLEVPWAAFSWLQGLIKEVRTDFRVSVEKRNEVYRRRREALRPLVPPDLSFEVCNAGYIPSSSIGDFPLLSDPVDPSIALRAVLEARILDNGPLPIPSLGRDLGEPNEKLPHGVDLNAPTGASNNDHPLHDIFIVPSSPPLTRIRPVDAKLEPPLMPPLIPAAPPVPNKPLTFTDLASEGLLAAIEVAANAPRSSSPNLEAILGKSGKSYVRNLQQEQLIPADTTMRLQVPMLDFEKKLLPWKQPLVLHPAELQAEVFEETDLPSVRVGQKIERETLRWNPFLKGVRDRLLNEQLDRGADKDEWLASLGIVESVDNDPFFTKPVQTSMFAGHPALEELLPALVPKPKDLEGAVRKRKREVDRDEQDHRPGSVAPLTAAKQLAAMRPTSGMTNSLQQALLKRRQTTQMVQRDPNPTAADPGLSSFLYTRNQAVPMVPKTGPQPVPRTPSPQRQGPLRRPEPVTVEAHERVKPQMRSIPSIPGTQVSRTFLISSRFLRDHMPLLRQIELIYPNSSLVEDSTYAQPRPPFQPQSTSSGFSSSPVCSIPTQQLVASSENPIDLKLDPTTVFIFTSIGFIKQRPLPGQKVISGGVRERILSAVQLNSRGSEDLAPTTYLSSSRKKAGRLKDESEDWKLVIIVILQPASSWEIADPSREADKQALIQFETWLSELADWSGKKIVMKAWQDDEESDGPEPLRGLAVEIVKEMVCHDGFGTEM